MASVLAKLNMADLAVSMAGTAYCGMSVPGLTKAGVASDVIAGAAKTWLKSEIDLTAESMRNSVLTPGAGQAMEYQEAQAQASAALSSPNTATPATFPMLAATIGIDIDPSTKAAANDVLGVARAVLAQAAAWGTIGAAIRAARLKGKAAVEAAPDLDAAVAAFDAIAWPTISPGA